MKQIHKKLWSFLLIAVLLMGTLAPSAAMSAQASSSKAISKALTSKTYKSTPKYSKSAVYLPDFDAFVNYEATLKYRQEITEANPFMEEIRTLPKDTAQTMAEEYLKLLLDDRFHLKVVDEYHGTNYFTYYFVYTGTGKVTPEYFEKDSKTQKYHVRLYYESRKNSGHDLTIYYSKEFKVVDTLDRLDGTTAKNETIKGTSARKAIIKTSDSKYQTSDKRLSVKAGYADIIINGKHYSKKASFSSKVTSRGEYTYDFISIPDVWDKNSIELRFPAYNTMKSGDLYNMADFTFYPRYPKLNLLIENTAGGLLFPSTGPSNHFGYVTLRIPKWDTGSMTVVYLAAKYTDDGKEYTIEGLIAVKYKDPMGEVSETVTLEKGTAESFSFDNPAFLPNYETYEWTIISGSDKITLSNKTSRTCKVKGKKKGTAVIRVIYEYGVDEPDILTGIERNVNRSKSKLYRIKVVD